MIKKIIVYFLSVIIIVMMIYAILIVVIGTKAYQEKTLPSLFGYSYSIIASDSMKPAFEKGDVAFIKQVDFEELILNDIVVYYSEDKDIFIVHRLIELNNGSWIAKGDANLESDVENVTINNYYGKVIKTTKFLYLGRVVLGHRYIFFVIVFLLFLMIVINELVGIFKIIELKKTENLQKQQSEAMALEYETKKAQMREEILAEIKKNKFED